MSLLFLKMLIPTDLTSRFLQIPILILFGGVSFCVYLIINYKNLKLDKPDKFILAFIFLVGISTIFSINLEKSIWGQSNRYEGLLTFICYFLTLQLT